MIDNLKLYRVTLSLYKIDNAFHMEDFQNTYFLDQLAYDYNIIKYII